MTLLVDTHVVAWMLIESEKISKKAVQVIRRARRSGSGLAIASVTLYELAQGIHRGRIRIEATPEAFLGEVERSFGVLSLNAVIAERAVRIGERFPGDPMDRIIVATAIVEGISLVTADQRIQESRVVETIW